MKNIGKVIVLSTGIIIGGVNFPPTPYTVSYVEASTVVKIPKTTYKSSVNLVLRSGAGNHYGSLLTIPTGGIVTSQERVGNWYKVSYTYKSNGKNITSTGWVWGSFLQHHHTYTSINSTDLLTHNSAYLYPTPDTGGPALYKVNSNFELSSTQKVINSRGNTLYRVSHQGKSVYVKAKDVNQIVKIPKTSYKTDVNLNLRTGPGNHYNTQITMPAGSVVTSQDRIGNWYRVSYKNGNTTNTGWVWGSYLKHYHKYNTINDSSLLTHTSAYLYPTPDTGGPALYRVNSNYGFDTEQEVTNSRGQTLYTVNYKGKTVYVKGSDVNKSVGIPKTNYRTTVNLNLRSGPGDHFSSSLTMPTNSIVTSQERIGNWYKVSYSKNGDTTSGWVWGSYLQHYHTYTSIDEVSLVTQSAAYLYPTPDTGRAALFRVDSNDQFNSTQRVANSRGETLYRVSYQGKTVYLKAADITIKEAEQPQPTPEPEQPGLPETAMSGKLYAATANVNLRASATTDSDILTLVKDGSLFYPTHSVSNGWVKISYEGKTGYVSGDFAKEVVTGDPMHRNGYQFIDLRTTSKVSAEQINNYISNNLNGRASVLSGKGQAFIDAGNKYGVNALYLAAKAIHESGFGTSSLSLGKYNLFGFGAYDAAPYIAAYRFPSVEGGIEYIAQEMKATYLNSNNWKYQGPYLGFSTKTVATNTRIDAASEGLNFYYASDPKWGQKIATHMERILPYNKADYDNATANTRVFSAPDRPAGADIFPNGIEAVAMKDLALSSTKGGTTVKTLKSDTSFIILEKHNDFWIKVNVDGTDYWTKTIQLDRYKDYVSVKNLGRITASPTLNVRPTDSTAQAAIGSLNHNDYVQLVLDKDGNVTTNSAKTWYQVKLENGTVGWVSASFVALELK